MIKCCKKNANMAIKHIFLFYKGTYNDRLCSNIYTFGITDINFPKI